MTLKQIDIGSQYLEEKEEVLVEKIAAVKKKLGDQVMVLCHHYQQESVFAFADSTGDSLKLAKDAAQDRDRPYIVFCGVHFMAESADILTSDRQAVLLPDRRAGCPMADMAVIDDVEWAWRELEGVASGAKIIPVTYVNSSARIKAFVGERGGAVCTSSNAERVLTWALSKGDKVFFFPDEHLGRNSAIALGIPEDAGSKAILWNGYCTVHMQFTADHVRMWRKKDPKVRIIVHPECRYEVVGQADGYGSTETIIKTISESEPGSKWAVGTEINLVNRLSRQFPDREVHSLSPFQCLCATMYRIKPAYLLWVLENLAAGRKVNRITVDLKIAEKAKLALDRMLEI